MNASRMGSLTQHPWAEDVTQFVNIESTGSYGPDVVFQEQQVGPWRIKIESRPLG